MEYVGAYVVRGGARALEAVIAKLETEGVVGRGSPDLFARSYRSFGVDDANEVRNRARAKPLRDAHRTFVLFAPSMTTEAQNALLKTLEEPASGAVFFLVTPSPETLLPTIRSRVQTLLVASRDDEFAVDTDYFLAASREQRLALLKPLYDHEDEGRDMGGVIAFLSALERRLASEHMSPAIAAGVRAIYRARKYATDKGSLLKTLLEHVALLTPKV